jgi:hypothetical protein
MVLFQAKQASGLLQELQPYIDGKELSRDEAEEIAGRFDVSARTVYRRLDACRTNPAAAALAAARAEHVEPDMATAVFEWPLIGRTPEGAPPGPDASEVRAAPTVLELLPVAGPAAFRFDWELTGLAYIFGGNIARLHEELTGLGFKLPSPVTVWRRWRELPPLIRDGAKHGVKNRTKFGLYLRNSAGHANEIWQLDAFNLDIEVRVRSGKSYERLRPTLLLLIDAYSRFCVEWSLTYRRTHAEDVKALFGSAFELRVDPETGVATGGVPESVIVDNEAAIVAEEVREGFLGIPMAVRPAPAHTPIAKGKVERAGQTIQAMIVTGQPGVQTESAARNGDHLLHLADADLWDEEGFLGFVANKISAYNDRAMKELRGLTRKEAYLKSLVDHPPRPVSDEILSKLMLPVGMGGKRFVSPTGIEVNRSFFTAPELGAWVDSKQKVRVLRWHHNLDRVAVLDNSGSFICMAKRIDLLSDKECSQIVSARYNQEREILAFASYARTGMAAASQDRELRGPSGIAENSSVVASPVPASKGKGGSKSAKNSKKRRNASKPSSAPTTSPRLRPLTHEDPEAIAFEQMNRRFAEDKEEPS